MKLSREQRQRILDGDYSALKLENDPGDVEGQQVPILRRKAHKRIEWENLRFVGDERRFKEVVAMPEHWSLWIELGKPVRHRKGHWLVEFTVHDERQADRVLRAGGPPGASGEPGLRTRLRKQPRPKGEGVGSFTDESARGYGAGGDQVLDRGGVDDDELRRQRVQANLRRAEQLQESDPDATRRSQERRVRQALRERLRGLDPESQALMLARVEAAIRSDVDTKQRAA